jgi:hypothetical protein
MPVYPAPPAVPKAAAPMLPVAPGSLTTPPELPEGFPPDLFGPTGPLGPTGIASSAGTTGSSLLVSPTGPATLFGPTGPTGLLGPGATSAIAAPQVVDPATLTTVSGIVPSTMLSDFDTSNLLIPGLSGSD